MPTSKGRIIEGTKVGPNRYGVYVANVEIGGVKKGAKSTFFPKDWTPQQVVDNINEAYGNMKYKRGNTYIGKTASKIKIELQIGKNNKIITAYPLY